MSINIPAETADESTNPISVEEFERLHPAMYKAPSRRCMASLSSNEPQLSQSLTHRRTSVVRLSTYDFNAAGMLTSSFRHCSISERKPEMFSLSLSSIRTSSSTHLSAMVCKARTAAASNLSVAPANVLKFIRYPFASSENDSHKAFQIPGICDFAMSRRFTPRAISVSSVLSVLHMAVYADSTSFRNPSGCCSTSKNCSRYSAAFDIDSSPNCSARTSHMRDDTDFRRGPGGSPNAARHHIRKGGA